jgi:hypothetical protein
MSHNASAWASKCERNDAEHECLSSDARCTWIEVQNTGKCELDCAGLKKRRICVLSHGELSAQKPRAWAMRLTRKTTGGPLVERRRCTPRRNSGEARRRRPGATLGAPFRQRFRSSCRRRSSSSTVRACAIAWRNAACRPPVDGACFASSRVCSPSPTDGTTSCSSS